MSLVRTGSYKRHGFTSQKTVFFLVTVVKTSNLNIELTGWAVQWRRNVSPVRYELGFYIPEDGLLPSHRRVKLKYSTALTGWAL
jgi:hypothetical protein